MADLRALAIIRDTFGDRHPQAAAICRLLDRLTSQLGAADQRTYQRRQALRAPVQPAIDFTPYSALIADLEDAIGKRQLVSCAYHAVSFRPAWLREQMIAEVRRLAEMYELLERGMADGMEGKE